MSKARIILSIGAILLIIGLFLLPKVVVDNQDPTTVEAAGSESNHQDEAVATENKATNVMHNSEIPSEGQSLLASLKENFENSEDDKKSAIFADSLAAVFKSYNKLDSAAKYGAIAASLVPTKQNLTKAGDYYYDAFSFAVDPEKSLSLAENAREYYEKAMALGDEKEMLDIEAKIAMTYIASSNPMKGIGMLRDILEKDPNHEEAIYNLGILSIQSNQYDKAIERFEKLVSLYPENLQAQFYLGLSYFEAGKKEKAKKQFEKVKTLDKDPEVQAAVDDYLAEIK